MEFVYINYRYRNVFSDELVTVTGCDYDMDFNQTCVSYRRDNPVVDEFNAKMYEFVKPSYVFDRCYIRSYEPS